MDKKALIAMSGGVDSSVAALLTMNEGYACTGATMKLYENKDFNRPCGNESDIADAKSVCERLSIPHLVFDFCDEFEEEIIARFIAEYETGATPNPCAYCNRYIKFGRLISKMQELGFDYIVTGHYAKISYENGRYLLKKAEDTAKDQSYFLYSLTQEQLSHIKLPLGDYSKEQIREIATQNGFINAKKGDSQDICFVPDGDYATFIEQSTGNTYQNGDFVDKDGNVLGTHKGIIRYTVGQRKGLGLALPHPMYVCEKNVSENKVVLCKDEELFSRELFATDFNWIALERPQSSIRCLARVRYRHKEQPATVTALEDGRVKVIFDEPQRAIAKGQIVVLYDGDTVLGGGTII